MYFFIKSLFKPEILKQLVDYIINEKEEKEHRFTKIRIVDGLFKNSRLNQLEYALLSKEDIMDHLIKFLDNRNTLDPLLSSFFCKVISAFISKFCTKTISYFKKNDNFLDNLIYHIETSAIMDLLNKILTISYSNERIDDAYKWFQSTNVIIKIVNVFNTSDKVKAHENAAILLINLINSYRNACISDTNLTILDEIER